jgi:hypothetical protein
MGKISITKIITDTFLIPYKNIQFFSRVLVVPIAFLVLIWSIWLNAAPSVHLLNYLFYLLYFIAFAYLAIICHKLILTENKTIKSILTTNIKTLSRFLFLMFGVYLLSSIIEYLIINIYLGSFNITMHGGATDELIKQNRKKIDQDIEIAQNLAYLPSMYIFGRLCLVFPATVLGYKTSLKWSWKATKNNQFKILFIIALFPWALQIILYAFYRENASIFEQALISLLTYLSTVLGVFSISLTYKELYAIEQKKL